MERLNVSKKDIINAFNKGKVIRLTCGIWNSPQKDGRICRSVNELLKFYDWAYLVSVYKSTTQGIDYDLVGASGGDMF